MSENNQATNQVVAMAASAKLHQYQELEQIYNQTFGQGIRALTVVSATPEEGVTTLITALAERNLLAGKSTLVVDLNLHHPSLEKSLAIVEQEDEATPMSVDNLLNQPIQLVNIKNSQSVFTGICINQRRDILQKLHEPSYLRQQIQIWLAEFDHVLIDTSALNQRNQQNIPTEQVAAACEGCILLVQAGRTTETMVQSALARLEEANAELLGCVINDQYNPRLESELCREIKRMERYLPKLVQWLCRRIKQTRLLSTEI